MAIFSFSFYQGNTVVSSIRELKPRRRRRRRRQWKRRLKNESAILSKLYLDPLNLSNVGQFSWSEFLRSLSRFKKERNIVVLSSRPRPPMIKRRIRKFHVYVAQLTSKKKKNILRKKRDASAELLFCLKTNRFFFGVVIVVVGPFQCGCIGQSSGNRERHKTLKETYLWNQHFKSPPNQI